MPDASKQTKIHHVQLAVTGADLQAAIDDAIAAAAGKPVHVVKTSGQYHAELCTLITAALTSHLSVGA